MAAPNIVNVATIYGKTSVQSVTSATTAIVTNGAGSNKVLKINTLIVSNIDGVNPADITVDVLRSSVSYKVASTVTVPADATLVVLTKDSSIYLEEGDELRLTGSTNGDLQALCSYEEIS